MLKIHSITPRMHASPCLDRTEKENQEKKMQRCRIPLNMHAFAKNQDKNYAQEKVKTYENKRKRKERNHHLPYIKRVQRLISSCQKWSASVTCPSSSLEYEVLRHGHYARPLEGRRSTWAYRSCVSVNMRATQLTG